MAKQKKKSYTSIEEELQELSIEEELQELGSKLTEKQLLFCEYFLPTLNATTSYKKAYKCSYNVAMSNGSRLMVNAKIRAYIDCMKRLRAQANSLSQEDILEKYKKIAFADISDYVEVKQFTATDPETGEEYTYNRTLVKDSEEFDGTIVSEISKDAKGNVKVKLVDKTAALKFLSNYTNMLNDDEIKKLQAAKLSYEVENLKKGVNVNAAQITIVNSWDGEEDEN